MAGIDLVHVPYRNSGEARNGVIGGQVQMMIDAVTTMAPNVSQGQVRALATTGEKRSSVLPDVPTAEEAGVPGYEATIWLGLMAPTGTPKPIIDQAERRRQRRDQAAGDRQALGRSGRGADVDDAGGVRQIPARRYREMGRSRQDNSPTSLKDQDSLSPMPNIRFRLNGVETDDRRRSRYAAAHRPARAARPDRSAFRLRRRRMRRLQRHHRRPRGDRLRHAAVVGRGQGRHHHRGTWEIRRSRIRCSAPSSPSRRCNAAIASPAS